VPGDEDVRCQELGTGKLKLIINVFLNLPF